MYVLLLYAVFKKATEPIFNKHPIYAFLNVTENYAIIVSVQIAIPQLLTRGAASTRGPGSDRWGMGFPHGPLRARGSAWHSSLVAGATRDSTRHASWPLRGHTEILHSHQIAFAYVLCQRLRLSLFHTLFLWEMTLSHTFSVGNDFFPRFFSGKWLCPTESNLADFQLCPQRDLNPGLLQNADL